MTDKEFRHGLMKIKGVNAVGYRTVKKNTQKPYICCYCVGTDYIYADDIPIIENTEYNMELYTEKKDFEIEKLIKTFLSNNEIGYRITTDVRINEINANMVVFNLTLTEVL